MAHSTYQARSPQRQMPLFQSPGRIFGMSATDRLIATLRRAQDARQGILDMYAAARATLGRANQMPACYRTAEKTARSPASTWCAPACAPTQKPSPTRKRR